MVGAGGVGKSALTIQLISGYFIKAYDPTMEDSFKKECIVDDEPVVLDIQDTAGQEEYRPMVEKYLVEPEGFIIVYSVTDRESFSAVRTFRDNILRVKFDQSIPIVLVGNKIDLEDERQVSNQEGLELSRQFRCQFFETSALTAENVEEAFYESVRVIKDWRDDHVKPPVPPPPRGVGLGCCTLM